MSGAKAAPFGIELNVHSQFGYLGRYRASGRGADFGFPAARLEAGRGMVL
jgi:hypothetical protein